MGSHGLYNTAQVGRSAVSCECGNDHSVCVKCGELNM